MHRATACLGVVLASGTVLFGQQTSTPIFRGGAALVRVDVRVLDQDGKPVPGLLAGDFEITLDGRVQKVQTVDYRSTPTKQAVSATNEREATNATPLPASRLVVMLVDDLSFAATSDRDLFHAASRFVAGLPATDHVGFTTTSGEAVLNPTHDHQAVEIELRRSVGRFVDPRNQPPDVDVGLSEAIEIEKGNRIHFVSAVERNCLKDQKGRSATERDLKSQCADEVDSKAKRLASLMQQRTALQVASYKAVINAMRPFEGDKALVILSNGVTMGSSQLEAADIKALERDGATAGVHVSVLFPEPDSVNMTTRSADEAKMRREDGQALRFGLQNVAGATGGDFYGIIGQPERFFGFVTDAMSAVYHLGVEAPPGSAPGREFRLSARVTRPGLTVRANRVALQEAPAAPVPVDAQLDAVLARGEPKYGVPIAVGTLIRPGKTADDVALGVNVEVPAGVPGPLTLRFAAVDERGRSRTGRQTLSAQVAGTYRLSFSIPVPSASYRLRIGVADAQGEVGGLELPIVAQLNQVGPLRTSDILAAWTGADGKAQFLSLGKMPASANSLLMALELAPGQGATPPSDVRVAWTIVTESGQTVAEQKVAAAIAQNRLNAQARFSVGALPAGTYELRATVFIANQAAGVTLLTFRKADK